MKEPWIFDSHAHYNDRRFDDDRKELLSSMPENGVGYIMNVGCCLASSRDCVTLAETYDHIYCAVGSHPDHADEVNDEVLDQYRQMVADHPKIKAIGEIGLDYYYEDIPREIQKRAFRMQLELARELNLPVIIHERDAHGDAFDIVREFPECGRVPLLLRFQRVCPGAGETGLAHRLHRGHHLQKCPQGRGDGGVGPPGSAAAGDRLPLHGPRALPGPPQRLHHGHQNGGKDRGPAGSAGGGHLPHHPGKHHAAVWD